MQEELKDRCTGPVGIGGVNTICKTVPKRKPPGRKRDKLTKIQKLLLDLPKGFTFTGPPEHCTEEYIMEQLKNDTVVGNKTGDLLTSNKLEMT